jgi:hypothetical protein
MKERFARLDMSKLPEEYKKQFEVIKEGTENFADEDLNKVFSENFNDLYGLVESKHSGAIRTGGKIKKEKPAKVKVIKKKLPTEKDFELPGKIEAEIHGKKKGKLTDDDIEFIESTLRNDEASTDEELVTHFSSELGITAGQARKWVKLRNKYLQAPVEKSLKYTERKKQKKAARREKDLVKTRDGYEFNRKDPSMRGKKFYDENGKQWTCKRYEPRLDECIMADSEGKEISCCLRDMYVNNPISKREKGNLVDDCKDTLKEAGFTVKEHKAGKKTIRRRAPRPEKEIIKERVADTFTPILKDIAGSEEKQKENKEVIEAMERVQKLFVRLFNRLSNLADDGKVAAIEKIEKLLKELVGE